MEIRYSALISRAMRLVVRDVLRIVAENNSCDIVVSFATEHKGVQMSDELRNRFKDDMTVVLHNQYYDLEVGEESFSVTLRFFGVSSRLTIPFDSILSFNDRNSQFSLEFRKEDEDEGFLDGLKYDFWSSDSSTESILESSANDAKIVKIEDYLKHKRGEDK